MRSHVVALGQAAGVAFALSGPPPARRQPRLRRVDKIDDDEEATRKPALARGGIRIPAAIPPDAMHAEPIDRKETDALRIARIARDVVHQQAGALGNADAIRVLLVV